MSLWKMSRWIQHGYIVEGLGVQGLRLFCGQQLWQAIAGTSCRTRGSAEWPHQVPHYDNLLSPVEPPKFPWISKEEFVIRLLWPCSVFLGRTGSYTHHPSWNLVLELMRMGPNHWRPMDGSLMFKSSFSLMRGHLCERLRPQDFTPEFFKGHFTRFTPIFLGSCPIFSQEISSIQLASRSWNWSLRPYADAWIESGQPGLCQRWGPGLEPGFGTNHVGDNEYMNISPIYCIVWKSIWIIHLKLYPHNAMIYEYTFAVDCIDNNPHDFWHLKLWS